jgi:hypothetical protein
VIRIVIVMLLDDDMDALIACRDDLNVVGMMSAGCIRRGNAMTNQQTPAETASAIPCPGPNTLGEISRRLMGLEDQASRAGIDSRCAIRPRLAGGPPICASFRRKP